MSLKREQLGKVMVLTVDRPEARNAISSALAASLQEAIEDANTCEQTHVVVLTASGDEVFLAGGDLKELAQLPTDAEGAEHVLELGRTLSFDRCKLPIIAAVGGAVFGGGAELLLTCDLVVMDAHSSIRFVHAKMGLTPAWGGSTRLLERLGTLRAAELLLSSRRVDAEEALSFGLTNRVVRRGQARTVALALADELARTPRPALVAIKRSLSAAQRARRHQAFEAEAEVFRSVWQSGQQLGAIATFLNRKS